MNLDEAINHAQEVADRHFEILQENDLCSADKEACYQCARDHEQLAAWLVELRRLQSLEMHVDTYEADGYMFSYHEMAGQYTISIVKTDEVYREFVLAKHQSHETFVHWCDNWISTLEGPK